MMTTRLEGSHLKKVFNRRVIFQDVSFDLHEQETLVVTGRNGSGKSTLMKLLGRVLTPTEGSVTISGASGGGGSTAASSVGFVAPYLMMYDEFSARENLAFAIGIRGMRPDPDRIDMLLDKVSLSQRKHEPVRTFSSGMKQRVKYAFALVHRPGVLLLDEPMANLDDEGISCVRKIMEEQIQTGILVVATNDLTDVNKFDLQVDLNANR